MLMHAIAHGGCKNTVREDVLKADSGRKRKKMKKKCLAAPGTRTGVSISPGFSVGCPTSWAIPAVPIWQNNRDLLRAIAVTRGWKGHRNKSQHRKLTLEKNNLQRSCRDSNPRPFEHGDTALYHGAIPDVGEYYATRCNSQHVSFRRLKTYNNISGSLVAMPGHEDQSRLWTALTVCFLPQLRADCWCWHFQHDLSEQSGK